MSLCNIVHKFYVRRHTRQLFIGVNRIYHGFGRDLVSSKTVSPKKQFLQKNFDAAVSSKIFDKILSSKTYYKSDLPIHSIERRRDGTHQVVQVEYPFLIEPRVVGAFKLMVECLGCLSGVMFNIAVENIQERTHRF